MAEPLVSVNMITYNHAPYISQAIESVLNQKTRFPIELVIGEDCSTDGTRGIVFEYKRKCPDSVRVITAEENVGIRQNCYRTMKACRGKYNAFCEGDDYWHNPWKLQKQVDYLESHPECGLVYSSFDVYYANSNTVIKHFIRHMNWDMPKTPDVRQFVEGNTGLQGILTCTVMARRALCEQVIESDPYLHQGDHFLMYDPQLWAEIINIAPIHYLAESLATYRKHGESLSNSSDIKKRLRFQISNAELMLYLCAKYKLPPSLRSDHEASRSIALLKYAFLERNAERADEARSLRKTLTLKEWLWYFGAKNPLIYYPLRGISLIRRFCKEQNFRLS